MENLIFSADDRADNPHIATRLSTYICPRGQSADSARTISGFRAKQLADSVWNSANVRHITQSIDIRTILATCFSILQPVVVHEVRLLVSAIFNLNPHGRSAIARTENPRPPARKIHVVPHNYPRVSARNNHGILFFRVMYRRNSIMLLQCMLDLSLHVSLKQGAPQWQMSCTLYCVITLYNLNLPAHVRGRRQAI